jgi:hypothetical protein
MTPTLALSRSYGDRTDGPTTQGPGTATTTESPKPAAVLPKRFHGTVMLDATRVGRDASRVAEEVIAHLTGIVGAKVTVTLEVEAQIPSGASDQVVRIVTENSRTLKFTSHGFEKDQLTQPSGRQQRSVVIPNEFCTSYGLILHPIGGSLRDFAKHYLRPKNANAQASKACLDSLPFSSIHLLEGVEWHFLTYGMLNINKLPANASTN